MLFYLWLYLIVFLFIHFSCVFVLLDGLTLVWWPRFIQPLCALYAIFCVYTLPEWNKQYGTFPVPRLQSLWHDASVWWWFHVTEHNGRLTQAEVRWYNELWGTLHSIGWGKANHKEGIFAYVLIYFECHNLNMFNDIAIQNNNNNWSCLKNFKFVS